MLYKGVISREKNFTVTILYKIHEEILEPKLRMVLLNDEIFHFQLYTGVLFTDDQ